VLAVYATLIVSLELVMRAVMTHHEVVMIVSTLSELLEEEDTMMLADILVGEEVEGRLIDWLVGWLKCIL